METASAINCVAQWAVDDHAKWIAKRAALWRKAGCNRAEQTFFDEKLEAALLAPYSMYEEDLFGRENCIETELRWYPSNRGELWDRFRVELEVMYMRSSRDDRDHDMAVKFLCMDWAEGQKVFEAWDFEGLRPIRPMRFVIDQSTLWFATH